MPGHPGVGWVPAMPTWHTGIVGQGGDAPKRHINPGYVLGCNPQEQAAGLGDNKSLGEERRGGVRMHCHTEPCPCHHAPMPQ